MTTKEVIGRNIKSIEKLPVTHSKIWEAKSVILIVEYLRLKMV